MRVSRTVNSWNFNGTESRLTDRCACIVFAEKRKTEVNQYRVICNIVRCCTLRVVYWDGRGVVGLEFLNVQFRRSCVRGISTGYPASNGKFLKVGLPGIVG